MKKFLLIVSLSCSFLFILGCTSQKASSTKPEQDTSSQQNSPPLPTVNVYAGENPAEIILGKSCWGEGQEACTVPFEDPDGLLVDTSNTKGKVNDRISFALSSDHPESNRHLMEVDEIQFEVIQFYKGEQQKLGNVGPSFQGPTEPGLYQYLATLTWEGETKGQANFAFSFVFQE